MSKLKVSKDAIYAKGGRKSSTSRVYMQKGSGKITINGKLMQDYFGESNKWTEAIMAPLLLLKKEAEFDFICFAKGGGVTGQAEAIRLGISRCLDHFELKVMGRAEPVNDPVHESQSETDEQTDSDVEVSAEMPSTWRKQLRTKGYLTRDSRAVLRKRVGFKKARKRPQYSKR